MKSSRFQTTAGFGLMLFLMAALLTTGLAYLSEMQANLMRIVADHNVKMNLIWDMRHAARERAMILHTLLRRDDPFDRDEAIQRFNLYARDFIDARQRLADKLVGEKERAMLGQCMTLARQGEAAQRQYVEAVADGRVDGLENLLIQKIMPIQESVMTHLTQMLEDEQRASLEAGRKATEAADSAQRFMLGLGSLALLVGVGVAYYVTRRATRIEADLHREKERAQITLDSIGEAVITTDTSLRVTYLNPAAKRLTAWTEEDAAGRHVDEVVTLPLPARGQAASFSSRVLPAPEGAAAPDLDKLEISGRDGMRRTVEPTVCTLNDLHMQSVGMVLVLRDVTRAHELATQLTWAATHDTLTGLINRTEFEHRLNLLLESARTDALEHAILYMDLDQFKIVNDTCGHMAGDDLLRQLSAILESHIRDSDTLARLGGDEFGVLLQGCPLARATRIAENLRAVVADFRFMQDDKMFDVGVSIGVAPITAQTESVATLLSAVDAACYVAKDKGRNQVHVYQPGDNETYQRTGEMQWAQRISQAIKDERLELHAQKIVPLGEDAGHPPHLEMLVRLRDEDGRLVSPGTFIPAAERYGLMPALDRWVIRTVFQCLARHPDMGRDNFCAINLSGQTLGDPAILPFIMELFEGSAVPPGHICFEITETAAVANLRAAGHLIQSLRALGCRFALDDFGSGMSSFGYLRQLKVDYLKIDGAFVKDIATDPTDRAMVEAINNIGHVMGLRTIAEYVENAETAILLQRMGVDFAQGFGIHAPEPIIDMIRD